MMINWMPLLQLSDSQFPSGAFSHSFGFETYIQQDVITDAESFKEALAAFLDRQLAFNDGLAFWLAYQEVKNGGVDLILELDHLLYASTPARETREGNQRVGKRLAKLCLDLYPSHPLEQYHKWLMEKEGYGHPALVFAVVYGSMEVSGSAALETFLFTSLSSMVQNAVRGIPIGQTDGQKILVTLQPHIQKTVRRIKEASIEDLGAGSPGLEIAQMMHERLHVRLFMS
ncbi:urease accessory protein UreF [Halobacillus litoralis]|uniref:urease accessory protein UreF n=1 Tax=Halobacillus litoralis TaxID=45668 RepID=UPI001CD4BEF1|nr:urease accessory protein UreF [Halobacillus litoralis]